MGNDVPSMPHLSHRCPMALHGWSARSPKRSARERQHRAATDSCARLGACSASPSEHRSHIPAAIEQACSCIT
jgi:hypothetical protein